MFLKISPGRGRGSRLISAKQAKLKEKSTAIDLRSIYTHYTELYVVRVGPAELIPYRLTLSGSLVGHSFFAEQKINDLKKGQLIIKIIRGNYGSIRNF